MSAKGMLCAMVAGTALVIVAGTRRSEPARAPAPARPAEVPWLSPEAAAQIVGPGGTLGPLFSDLTLGGSPPSPAARARIAEFARANHVQIDLDVIDDELAAVRFAVSYAGCCGYEGADVLALRLGRPSTGHCCVCGPDRWIDNWSIATDDGNHMRGRVRVNRVDVVWERTLSEAELIERADDLLGKDADKVGAAAREAWVEVEHGHDYSLAMPYLSEYHDDLRVDVVVARGTITAVSLSLRDWNDDLQTKLETTLKTHWGRPHKRDSTWTWHTADRVITAELDGWPKITLQKPSADR